MESSSICLVVLILVLAVKFTFKWFVKWLVVSNIYKRYFAALHSYCARHSPSQSATLVAQLMEKLSQHGGDVLEIGAASGRNFKYMNLPDGSSYIAVDYNANMESYLRENLANFPDIRLREFIVQDAGNMTRVQDNSVTAVLGTQILCSIEENKMKAVLSEVKRVLKPGGYYFFMEHVIDEPRTLRRVFQNLASGSGLMPLLFDGCNCNKETWKHIQEAGFRKVTFEKNCEGKLFAWSAPVLSILGYITRVKIYGYAVKRD